MTTYAEHSVTCAACGTENSVPVLTSTSAFGPCDLDLRPAEPMRGTLAASVQYCSGCTRYALRLDDPVEMHGAPRLQPIDYSLDGFIEAPTAYVFRRRAERALASNGLAEAVHHFLCAAWLYDDHESPRARGCREQAAAAMQALHATGDTFNEDRATDLLLLADLQRRSGHFEQARACAEQALQESDAPALQAIARYQLALAASHDTACHSVADAETA